MASSDISFVVHLFDLEITGPPCDGTGYGYEIPRQLAAEGVGPGERVLAFAYEGPKGWTLWGWVPWSPDASEACHTTVARLSGATDEQIARYRSMWRDPL